MSEGGVGSPAKNWSINRCPISHPASSRHTAAGRSSTAASPHRPLFRPEGPLVSPAQASGLGTRSTQGLEGPTARPFAAVASESPNGRPFRPQSFEGVVDQGRWPWLGELSGPWGLNLASLEACKHGPTHSCRAEAVPSPHSPDILDMY